MNCRQCHNALDSLHRGDLCGSCWFRYVRSFFTDEAHIARVRASMTTIKGNECWFLPDETPVAFSLWEESEITG